MPKRMPLVIGDLKFAIQKEALLFFQAMLRKYNDYDTLSDIDQGILLKLIERHPEAIQKIGCGIKHFFKAPADERTSCFWLEREDGSKTDFSYLACIRGKGKTLFQEFMEACRETVREDLIEAKYSYFKEHADKDGKIACAFSGEKITVKQSHLDHVKPLTFQVIVVTFVKANNIQIDKRMLSESCDGQFQASFVDQCLKEKFRAYHHSVADLRIIKKDLNFKFGALARIKKNKNSVPIKFK